MPRLARYLCVTVVLACLLAGCSRQAGPSKIIVLGIDGADPYVIDMLMAEGKMPSFARLRQEGAYGRLISSKPLLSPIIWTTIATGKTPDQHNIGHFVTINQKTGRALPVSSSMRRVKALWNVFSEAGRSVATVGWWASWPAEPVNGTVVSDHACYHFLFDEGQSGPDDLAGVFYPPEKAAVLQAMIRRPDSLTMEDTAAFINVSAKDFNRPFRFSDELGHFKWALSAAESYRSIGLRLLADEHPDLLMIYIEGVDSTSHLFGHLFRAKGLAGELAEQQKRYGKTVESMYLYADRLVGDFLDAMDQQTTLVVLSDHGFKLGELPEDPSRTRDMRRVSERFHRLEGILYMYGRAIVPHSRIDRPVLVDIAPTVLALAGISPARDMPGRVLTEALTSSTTVMRERTVASYETGEPVVHTEEARDPAVDAAILERLRSLGYLDTRSPSGERNLAALQFENGRYDEAVKAYRELVRKNPDDGALRASLAGALGATGHYDEALEQLREAARVAPLNPEIYHNRGVIFERQGNTAAAIQEYRTALRYAPDYEASRQALLRLTGSALAEPVHGEAEGRASIYTARAQEAARHGDYEAAMGELDKAERIAPGFARVYEYRGNVAFLMGDRDGAIKALEKALQIEPGNALVKHNLETLEKGAAQAGVAK